MNRSWSGISLTRAFLFGVVVMASAESGWGQTIAWTRLFGSTLPTGNLAYDFAYAVALDTTGNIYVAGNTEGSFPGQTRVGGVDAFVRKYNADGNELWTRQFGTPDSDYANAVAVGGGGSIYVAGYTSGSLPGQSTTGTEDVFVRKYDASGTELWTRQFGTSDSDQAYAVAVDASGSIYVAGLTFGTLSGGNAVGGVDAFVRKYSANGAVLWTRQFGTADLDIVAAMALDTAGSIYVAGWTGGTFPGQSSSGFEDAFVSKYDATGTALWARQFGTSRFDRALSVAADAGGSIYVAGSTDGTLPGQSSAGGGDAFVRKYESDGTELWTRQFGAPPDQHSAGHFDVATAIVAGADSIINVAGLTSGTLPRQSSANLEDAFVRKYHSNGSELWTRQFGSAGLDDAQALAVDAGGSLYVAGFLQKPSVDVDAFLTKFVLLCPTVPGDVNGDCVVDCGDLAAVRAVFGLRAGQPGWYARADVVTNNIIDIRDSAFIARRLPAGTSCQ